MKQYGGYSEDNPDVVWIVEAFSGQAEDTLFCHKPLNELEVGLEAREPGPVDPDHHVHRPLRHHWHQTGDAPELGEGQLGVALDDVDGVVEEGLGRVCQDGRQRPLDQGV